MPTTFGVWDGNSADSWNLRDKDSSNKESQWTQAATTHQGGWNDADTWNGSTLNAATSKKFVPNDKHDDEQGLGDSKWAPANAQAGSDNKDAFTGWNNNSENKFDDSNDLAEGASKLTGECYNCGEVGHNKADCSNPKVDRPFTGTCRNCDGEGHMAKDCEQPKKLTGECFNCGQTGHNKADCANPKVDRPFTGTCRHCNEEGHMAKECPTKPPQKCRVCLQEGHKSTECENPRIIDRSHVLDADPKESWNLMKQADSAKDMESFKMAVQMYVKARPEVTYYELEQMFREEKFAVNLIGVECAIPNSATIVSLQGKQNCLYVVTYNFGFTPRRRIMSGGWPKSPEQNLERLKQAGEIMENVIPMCRNCSVLGHTAKHCPEEVVERTGALALKCINCDQEGHRLRDCPEPRVDRNACRNCGQSGHKASECEEPRSAAHVECRGCGEMGHFAKDCPARESTGGESKRLCRRCGDEGHFARDCPKEGQPESCRNCGEEGHFARDCDKPKNPANVMCRNCDEMGHISRECPKPRDWSRVKCTTCGQMGHSFKKCPDPNNNNNEDRDASFGTSADWGQAASTQIEAENEQGVQGGWDQPSNSTMQW